MTRIVPHQNIFDQAQTFDRISGILIVISTVLSGAPLILDLFFETGPLVVKTINTINCGTIALVFIFDNLFNHYFYIGGTAKRLDFIDNSLGTDFSGQKSQGYFSNDGLPKGIYKMAVNCFENAYFTSRIASKMLTKRWIYVMIIILIFVMSAAWGEHHIVTSLFQLSLPILMAQNAIRLTQFSGRMSIIYQGFLNLFNDLKQHSAASVKEPDVLRLILDYQTTIAWGTILLDKKIFNAINPKLSKEWSDMKENYGIE